MGILTDLYHDLCPRHSVPGQRPGVEILSCTLCSQAKQSSVVLYPNSAALGNMFIDLENRSCWMAFVVSDLRFIVF